MLSDVSDQIHLIIEENSEPSFIEKMNVCFAVFLVPVFKVYLPTPAEGGDKCDAGIDEQNYMFLYEMTSMCCFIISIVLTLFLKNHFSQPTFKNRFKCAVYVPATLTSVLGTVFFSLSYVELIRVKLGLLSCGGIGCFAVGMVVLCQLVAFMAYFSSTLPVFNAFFRMGRISRSSVYRLVSETFPSLLRR